MFSERMGLILLSEAFCSILMYVMCLYFKILIEKGLGEFCEKLGNTRKSQEIFFFQDCVRTLSFCCFQCQWMGSCCVDCFHLISDTEPWKFRSHPSVEALQSRRHKSLGLGKCVASHWVRMCLQSRNRHLRYRERGF